MSSPVTGAIPANPSPEVKLIIAWMTALCDGDFDKLATLVTEDFVHYVHPSSLGFPKRNKTEWLQFNKDGFDIFKNFKITVHEIVEGQSAVVVHASSNATTSTGYPYANEYSLFFHLTAETDGSYTIDQLKEFMDSQYAVEFFLAEKKRQEAAGNKVVW
ncbi:unnamed protein product [Somion occarium]|uniref:SnoaL-like domain-containing protein n=1 Tax=Somion occarium TaxID=3059160 RepID=A0ABP1ED98_9APHY